MMKNRYYIIIFMSIFLASIFIFIKSSGANYQSLKSWKYDITSSSLYFDSSLIHDGGVLIYNDYNGEDISFLTFNYLSDLEINKDDIIYYLSSDSSNLVLDNTEYTLKGGEKSSIKHSIRFLNEQEYDIINVYINIISPYKKVISSKFIINKYYSDSYVSLSNINNYSMKCYLSFYNNTSDSIYVSMASNNYGFGGDNILLEAFHYNKYYLYKFNDSYNCDISYLSYVYSNNVINSSYSYSGYLGGNYDTTCYKESYLDLSNITNNGKIYLYSNNYSGNMNWALYSGNALLYSGVIDNRHILLADNITSGSYTLRLWSDEDVSDVIIYPYIYLY